MKNKNFEGTLTKTQENMLVLTVMLGCFVSVLNMTNINIVLPNLMEFSIRIWLWYSGLW